MMRRFQLFLAFFICSTSFLTAQKISPVSLLQFQPPGSGAVTAACTNFAGTYSMGPFYGQSNHHDITDTVFLCLGDTLHLMHNKDYDLSGDPQPATPPGVGSAFYQCPPTTPGTTTYMSVKTDSCIWPSTSIYVAVGDPAPFFPVNFMNNGVLQEILADSKPFLFYLAPITLDDITNAAFETAIQGGTIGPCVHVNSSVAFPIVYLYDIEASDKSTGPNNLCRGKFRLKGGLPEFNTSTVYSVNITLTTDTSVHAILLTPSSGLKHNQMVEFEVPQPGVYRITVEDGKSCGLSFLMVLNTCIPVGTDELMNNRFSVQVSPNPVQNSLRLNLSAVPETGVFNLYDATGRLVKSIVSNKAAQDINTENLVQGIYFWQYRIDGILVKSGKIQKV